MAALAVATVFVSVAPASALEKLSAGPRVALDGPVTGVFYGVSCTSAMDCTAVGGDAGGEPFYATESGGVWGAGTEIGGGGSFGAVSCTASLACTATGAIGNSLYATQTNGAWVAGPPTVQSAQAWSGFSDVSCTAAKNCAAVGSQSEDIHTFPLVETEDNGVWAQANFGWPTFGPLLGVSCTTATDCTAVGNDGNGEGYAGEPTYVTESGGVWGTGTEVAVPGNGGYFRSVSCPSTNDCLATGGEWSGGSFYVVDKGGVWGTPTVVGPPPAGTLYALESVSCADAMDCAIVGTEFKTGGSSEPIAVTESGGVWGPVTKVSVAGDRGLLTSVSCAVSTSCTAVGQDGHGQPIYVNETDGVWGAATEVWVSRTVPSAPKDVVVVAGSGRSTISWGASTDQDGNGAVSFLVKVSPGSKTCKTFATTCTFSGLHNGTTYSAVVSATNAVGTGLSAVPVLPFIPGAPVTTVLHLSEATVTYGDESMERLSVTVAPRHGSARPAGRVLILANSVPVCSMALRAGVGSCAPNRIQLNVGSYHLDATYLGDSEFATTSSAATSLKVSPAATTVQLKLSMVTVRASNESSETFSVTVIPQYVGGPRGTVTIHTSSLTLCSLTVGSASGSCRLRDSELPPGTYHVVATYHGRGNFKASKSNARLLTITS